jgi:hypothetical protein
MPPLTAKYNKKERKAMKEAGKERTKKKRVSAIMMPAKSDAKNSEQPVNEVIEVFDKMSIDSGPVLLSCNNDESFIPPRNNLGCHKPTDPGGLRWDAQDPNTWTLYDDEDSQIRCRP